MNVYRIKVVDDNIKDTSRANTIEAIIVDYANKFYTKKNPLGYGLNKKEEDEVIKSIYQDPVFKRYIEQKVRQWIKENKDEID